MQSQRVQEIQRESDERLDPKASPNHLIYHSDSKEEPFKISRHSEQKDRDNDLAINQILRFKDKDQLIHTIELITEKLASAQRKLDILIQDFESLDERLRSSEGLLSEQMYLSSILKSTIVQERHEKAQGAMFRILTSKARPIKIQTDNSDTIAYGMEPRPHRPATTHPVSFLHSGDADHGEMPYRDQLEQPKIDRETSLESKYPFHSKIANTTKITIASLQELQTGPRPNPTSILRSKPKLFGVDFRNQIEADYGKHRSGWAYALQFLKPLHKDGATYLSTFIERTFVWHPKGPRAIKEEWVGFIHVPPLVPGWFQAYLRNQRIFSGKYFQESLPYCKGLIALSKYHQRCLQNESFPFPISALVPPLSEIPEMKWTVDKFRANPTKRIVQVGWWLRCMHAIFMLPPCDYQKALLGIHQDHVREVFEKEKEILASKYVFFESMYDTATTIPYLTNDEYDKILSENLIFLHLYDASANNAIIECIARDAPVLVNEIEPVTEYLGKEYPLYYSSYHEAVEKAMNLDLVYKAHQYIKSLPIKGKLSGEYFRQSFMTCEAFLNAQYGSTV